MGCEKRERVQDYLDGRMGPREAAAMAAHLRACAACARDAEEVASLHAAIRALPQPDPGPDFTAAILCRVRRMPAPAARSPFSLSPGEAALLVLLYGALAGMLLPASVWLARLEGFQAVLTALRAAAAGAFSMREAFAAADPRGWLAAVPSAAGSLAAVGAAAVLAFLYRGSARPVNPRVLGDRP